MTSLDGFYVTNEPEPHQQRRKDILKKYPEIEKLFGPDLRPIPIVLFLVISQLFIAFYAQYMNIPFLIFISWMFGGAISHALSLMTHEVSHNLIFKSNLQNQLFGILCNIGMGFPSSSMFKRYHMEHHQFQGKFGIDADIPLQWEGENFNSPILKAVFLFFQSVGYGIRPSIIKPKMMFTFDFVNLFLVIISNFVVFRYCGLMGLLYLIVSLVMGMGFHPVSGHFISEHYVFSKDVETYSYYGCLNLLCWNVGFHNEHHDFPKVPGWKLPMVRKIAKEFYVDLPSHNSWSLVLWKFIIDSSLGPFSRITRE